jgi:hypothetical protein
MTGEQRDPYRSGARRRVDEDRPESEADAARRKGREADEAASRVLKKIASRPSMPAVKAPPR